MGTKKGRIYGKGSPFKGAPQRFGGGSCPKLPLLDPPLVSILCLRSSILLQLKYLRGVFQLDVENIANVIAFYHCSSLMFVEHQ